MRQGLQRERKFFIDNLLVRIHFIIVMIRRTGLAPWDFEFPFPGSLTSTFLEGASRDEARGFKRRGKGLQEMRLIDDLPNLELELAN